MPGPWWIMTGAYLEVCKQMGKQTMGVPMQAFPHRTDNKLYRLQVRKSGAWQAFHTVLKYMLCQLIPC